ncbi:MAG: ferrous iron transport protein A [Marinilabiliaceae bacterium]|nr:ferrous iron transport protein A [Marinilabiliaceae bacterium]
MVTVLEMQEGKLGIISSINGGVGLQKKLENMGISKGAEIFKISRQWLKGPVIIRHGNTELAIGYNMAMKIMVDII